MIAAFRQRGHAGKRLFTSGCSARRNVRPVAGRSRVVQQFGESSGSAEKAAADAAVEAEVMKRVAEAARAEADAAAEKVSAQALFFFSHPLPR